VKKSIPTLFRRPLLAALVSATLAAPASHASDSAPSVAIPSVKAPVVLADQGTTWTLDNGIVKATVLKSSGKLTSIVYQGREVLNGHSESWEQLATGKVSQSVTIDPAANGGERAEVAVKGVTGRMDIELRYTLERGVSGFYTYAIYSHEATYPAAGEGESRFINQMTPDFNWLSVDADRNMPMISNADQRSAVVIHA
jgi:rhamnogalacturonan endolyase